MGDALISLCTASASTLEQLQIENMGTVIATISFRWWVVVQLRPWQFLTTTTIVSAKDLERSTWVEYKHAMVWYGGVLHDMV